VLPDSSTVIWLTDLSPGSAVLATGFGKTCALSALSALSRFLWWYGVFHPRPESGRAAPSGCGLIGGQALGSQLFKCHVDAFTADVAVKESSDFFSGQAFQGFVKSPADTIQNSVARGGVEDQGSAGRAVIPYGKCSLEMGRFDDRAAVKSRVDGTQAEDLGFGPAGGGTVEAGTGLA
jgi:hypothetical protein